ncbi:MAG: hypothetical protein AAGB12_10685 [Pseudomonadota bacterium]
MRKYVLLFLLLGLISSVCNAGVRCKILSFTIVTNGNQSNDVYLNGWLEGKEESIWINIANDQVGKHNVALALAAQMSGKTLSIDLANEEDTCANFPSRAAIGRIENLLISG